jgi:hypothetical protein
MSCNLSQQEIEIRISEDAISQFYFSCTLKYQWFLAKNCFQILICDLIKTALHQILVAQGDNNIG